MDTAAAAAVAEVLHDANAAQQAAAAGNFRVAAVHLAATVAGLGALVALVWLLAGRQH